MFNIALASLAGLALAAAIGPSDTPRRLAAEELKVGDTAPEFALPGSDGKVHKLSDYRGKTVVLAWFVKAFTGG